MPLRPGERLLIGTQPDEAARLAAETLAEAIGTHDRLRYIVLAGGSTPTLLYSMLTRPPFRDRLPWQQVHWFWGDERAVPSTHPDSNYRMAIETLLRPLGAPADHIHRMPADSPDLDAAAAEYEQIIRQFVPPGSGGLPVFDVVVLGIGPDGHTASLFPGSAALDETERLVMPNDVPGRNVWRLTMTYPLLKAARHILFFVTGSGKAEVMGRILSSLPRVGSAAPADPAGRLRDVSGRVTWVLDQAAARLVALPDLE